jgi:hypothetical protein
MIDRDELLACKMCGRTVKTMGGLLSHINGTHKVHQEWYYDTYFDNPCELCGTKIPFRGPAGSWGKLGYVARRRFCSLRCAGDWRIERHAGRKNDDGYILTHVRRFDEQYWPMLHAMRTSQSNTEQKIFEHRAVMAIKLGRSLKRSETVHHMNGNRTDNRPENLELRVGNHGPGATARCLTCPHCGKAYV